MLAALAVGTIENKETAASKPTKVNRAIATLLTQNSEPSPGITPLYASLDGIFPRNDGNCQYGNAVISEWNPPSWKSHVRRATLKGRRLARPFLIRVPIDRSAISIVLIVWAPTQTMST